METLNGSNLTNQLDFIEFAHVLIACGVAHLLLVVIPSLILGPLILGVFISNKKLRDPVAILFMCITAVCILGPLTYGLLLDLSLITDFPLLGSCEALRGQVFWFSVFFFEILLLTSNIPLAVMQYVSVRWGKRLSAQSTILIFIMLACLVLILTSVNFIYVASSAIFRMRGSLCNAITNSAASTLLSIVGTLVTILVRLPTFAVVGTFSFLTVRFIKKHTVNGKKVVRGVVIIMFFMSVSVVSFRLLPIFQLLLLPALSSTEENVIVSFIVYYSTDLCFPLFLILTVFAHKTVKTTISEALKGCNLKKVFYKRSNRVLDSSSSCT